MTYFSSANLVLTKNCNLKCPYCFVEKENIFMSEEIMKKSVEFLVNGAIKNNDKTVSIGFFGGEPTLAINQMDYIVDYTLAYLDKIKLERNIKILPNFNITTNGMIFDDKFEKLLLKIYKIQGFCGVQLSYDGPPEIETQNRPSKSGETSGNLMEKNIERIIQFTEYNKIPIIGNFCVHNVISKKTLPNLEETYNYFINKGFPIWHYPLPEENWEENDYHIYEEQMEKIVELISNVNPELFINISNFRMNPTCGPTCQAGVKFCGIMPNGDIYPCHRMAENKTENLCLGSVNKDGHFYIDWEKKNLYEELDRQNFVGKEQCKNCSASESCYTCIASNIESNILPNLCFPKFCDFMKIRHYYNIKVQKILKEKGLLNLKDNNKKCDCEENHEKAQVDLTPIITGFSELVDGISNNNSIVADCLEDVQNQIDQIRITQNDILNLLLVYISQNENEVKSVSKN